MTTYRDSINFDISAGPGAFANGVEPGVWDSADTRLNLHGCEGFPAGSTVAELELWFQPGQDSYEHGVSMELTEGDCLELAHVLQKIAMLGRDELATRVTRTPFDAFEIAQVAEYQPSTQESYIERVNPGETPWDDDETYVASFYTVYGHRTFPPQDSAPDLVASDDSGCFMDGVQVTRKSFDERQAWLKEVAKDTTGYGATAVADFEDVEAARDLAYSLAGDKPVHDYTEGAA